MPTEGVQELATATLNSDRVYPFVLLLGISTLPLLLSLANVVVEQLTGEPLFKGSASLGLTEPTSNARQDGERSANDIFRAGLDNLKSDPFGWMFGSPSALYSNAQPIATPTTAPTAMKAPLVESTPSSLTAPSEPVVTAKSAAPLPAPPAPVAVASAAAPEAVPDAAPAKAPGLSRYSRRKQSKKGKKGGKK